MKKTRRDSNEEGASRTARLLDEAFGNIDGGFVSDAADPPKGFTAADGAERVRRSGGLPRAAAAAACVVLAIAAAVSVPLANSVVKRRYATNTVTQVPGAVLQEQGGSPAYGDGVSGLSGDVEPAGTVTDAPGPGTGEGTDAPGTDPVPGEDDVCSIGGTFYTSLADAFREVKDGETVSIIRDLTATEAIYTTTEGRWYVNGNGHKITADIDMDGFINVEHCTLDVSNLKIVYEEQLHYPYDGRINLAALCVGTGGNVTLTDVDIVSVWGNCLIIEYGGAVTVNSGSYSIDPGNLSTDSNVISLFYACTLTVRDGSFTRPVTPEYRRSLIRLSGSAQTVVISGGVWDNACGRLFYNNGSAPAYAPRNITISGGTFRFGVDDTAAYNVFDPVFQFATGGGLNMTVSGGTWEIRSGCDMTFLKCTNKNTAVTITGGTFTNGAGELFVSSKEASGDDGPSLITVKGGTFTNTAGSILSSSNVAGGVVIEGGTFITRDADEAAAVLAAAGDGSGVTVRTGKE
jgi:hypothetical protein